MNSDRRIDSGAALRVILAGAGKMARHHAIAISRCPVSAQVVGIADPSPAARASVVEVASDAREFESLEDAVASLDADVVHVCTPPGTHARLAELAIRAGCHVYVEKPFARSVSEARNMLDLASQQSVFVCPGHQLLFERPAREAWELLPALGELQHIESYFAFRPVRGRGGQAPIRDEEQLLDVLPHPVYLLLAALEATGEPGPTEIGSLEVGDGTLHALLRRGRLSSSLVVTLTGRPVDSYLRLVGTNGSLHADFVRGIVLSQIGPGSSGIDKLLAPYRGARQLALGTTGAMLRRIAGRKRSYPGLMEIFEAFYSHVRGEAPAPFSRESVLETVRVQERVSGALASQHPDRDFGAYDASVNELVLVTGGTGFLGRAVVQELRELNRSVRVLARRRPASWRAIPGVEYVTGDLSDGLDHQWLDGVTAVVHCAAATSGGWEEHQSASIDATEHLVEAMTDADCPRLVHVSSIAVVEEPGGGEIDESSPYLDDSRNSGPYAWGKLESERIAREAAGELSVTIVRPGAIVDLKDFEPPGRLGKRVGNLFVAVGNRRERLGVVSLDFCARAIAHLADSGSSSEVVHLLEPELPSRRELVGRLRESNPDLTVIWIPRWTVRPLGFLAMGLQKMLRPKAKPVDVGAVFANRLYDTSSAAAIERKLDQPIQVQSESSMLTARST